MNIVTTGQVTVSRPKITLMMLMCGIVERGLRRCRERGHDRG